MDPYLAIQVVMMPRDTNPHGTTCGAGVGQARLAGIRAKKQWKDLPDGVGKVPYMKVTYVVKIHPEERGWDLRPLDWGPNWLDDDDRAQAFRTIDGHKYLGLLDGDGNPLCGLDGITGLPRAGCDTEPHFNGPWILNERVSFGSLGLPQSFAGL